MVHRIRPDPIPQGVGFPSQQQVSSVGSPGYLKQLQIQFGTILFYPDSQNPTFLGINANPNADPKAPNWKIYTIVYSLINPGFYTSIVITTGSWQALPIPH